MMSIRRRLVSAVCLFSLGSSTVIGDEKNPFAEWDKIQKTTNLAISENSRERTKPAPRTSSVEYFSPKSVVGEQTASQPAAPNTTPNVIRAIAAAAAKGAPTAAAEPNAAQPFPGEVLRERLQVAKTNSEVPSAASNEPTPASPEAAAAAAAAGFDPQPIRPDQSAAAAPAVNADPGAWPAAFDVRSQTPTQSSESAPIVNRIQRADFVATGDAFENVTQVSGSDAAMPRRSELEQSPFAGLTGSASPELPSAQGLPGATISVDARPEDAGPQSPGVTLQWLRHGDFNVGQPSDVELVVENTSKSIVRSVLVEAMVPVGLQVVEVIPTPLAGSATPSWTFGEMKPGDKRSVAMKVIPRQRGDVALNAFVRLAGFSTSSFAVQEPMIGIAVSGPDRVEVGQQVSYVVKVTNPGTGVASNVVIQSVVPDGLEHRKGSLLTIEIGTLNPGESRQAQLSLTAVKGGSQQMAIRVVADGGLTEQTSAMVNIAEPRLNLQIAGPAVQLSGRTEKYVLNVINEGSVPSANVRAKYRVPEGFEFLAADRGGKFSDIDRSIEWFVGTVQPGGSRQFEVTLRAAETGRLLHQAGVISEHGKITMAEHSTSVEGTAALDLKVVGSNNQPKIGEEITYEIRIANTGSRSATNVGLSCELPSGMSLKQAVGPTEYIAENGVLVFKSVPQIDAGKTVVVTVKAVCSREGSHRLRLRVASESISDPLIGEETSIVTAQ